MELTWNDILQFILDPYNIAYFFILLAYIIHDVLWMRVVLIAAHAGFLVLSIIHMHIPGLIWNPLFVMINLYHVIRLFWERRRIVFPPDIEAAWQLAFSTMARNDLLHFWNMGETKNWNDVSVIVDGKEPDALLYIMSGTARIVKAGTELNRLGEGRFLAEMGFLTGKPASADVNAVGQLKCRSWTYSVLEQMHHKEPELFSSFQGVIGRELARKIVENNPKRAIVKE